MTLLVIREIEVKTTVRAIIHTSEWLRLKTDDIVSRRSCGGTRIPHTVARRAIQHIYFERLVAVSPHSTAVPAHQKTYQESSWQH